MSIKFDIKNRFSGGVLFTAEIDADEGESVNLGLAVKAAVKAGADLSYADLSYADLSYADLSYANLTAANLSYANLIDANLSGADMSNTNLVRANLDGANLDGANLDGANLTNAYLNGVCGLNDWIKNIHIEGWPISYTAEVMQIGCQRHSFDAWRNFSDAEIRRMDRNNALPFWAKWKTWIFQAIELAPAKPTKAAADAAGGAA